MSKSLTLLAGMVMLLGSSAAWGGVVMTETESMVSGPTPRTAQRTVMIEGNREKMLTDRNQIITDLDKGVIYIIDPAKKSYMEMPFPPQGPMKSMIGGPAMHTTFTKTGKSRTVAGYKCEEYTGTGKFMMGDFSVVSCVSSGAPGAKEFSKFEKAMMAKLKDSSLALPSNLPDGVPLAQDTTTKMSGMAMPNLPPEAAAQLKQQMANRPPIVTKTEVTKLEVQKIADSEFQVPEGFTKRENPMMGGGMMGHPMGGGMGAHPGMGEHPGMGGAGAAPAPAAPPSPGQ
jgi:uncharacterized protein DUF4412